MKNNETTFDPSVSPPFRIADIRAAIPKHCWEKNPWRSLSYVVRDVLAAVGLMALAMYVDSWIFWPLYWIVQGSVFMGLFVIGHDCGHGSFSDYPKLNNVVGHVLLTFVLTPYHGFRIGHRTHHQNHGHAEKDEAWVPLSEKLYKQLDYSTKFLRFTLPFPLFAHPLYLLYRSPGKPGSHFDPNNELFLPSERIGVIISTFCWTLMVSLLLFLAIVTSPAQILKLYGVPYTVFVMWISCVTYLNHHGHEQKLPWYRGEEWNYLRGALTTVDRDYGWFSYIHHHLGTHVVHHLFPQIPHYHLLQATRAVKPVLGMYYREPQKSGPIPFHLITDLVRSLQQDHFVSDDGNVVFYQTDTELLKL